MKMFIGKEMPSSKEEFEKIAEEVKNFSEGHGYIDLGTNHLHFDEISECLSFAEKYGAMLENPANANYEKANAILSYKGCDNISEAQLLLKNQENYEYHPEIKSEAVFLSCYIKDNIPENYAMVMSPYINTKFMAEDLLDCYKNYRVDSNGFIAEKNSGQSNMILQSYSTEDENENDLEI